MRNIKTFDTFSGLDFQIFCDMDGVLTDFDGNFKAIKNNKKNISFEQWDKINGKFSAWRLIDEEGITWWSHMPWKEDGKQLWDYIEEFKPVILSAPSRNPMSARGKVIWVNRELELGIERATRSPKPQKWDEDSRMILCAQKYLFTKRYPNSILIDDTPNKIRDWRNNGGIGILHHDTETTIHQLEKIISNL